MKIIFDGESDATIPFWFYWTRASHRNRVSVKYINGRLYSLPIDDAASANESSLLVDRYSTITAVKTALLSEFVHMSFHLQNWFSGITLAKAAATASHSVNIGRTDSRIERTVGAKKAGQLHRRMMNGNHILPRDGVECILFSIPIMLRVFLSSSVICSLIFYLLDQK
jgi:hypothetical protein